MKPSHLYLLLALTVQNFCHADLTKLAPEDRKAVEDSERFHEVGSTSDLPAAIIALCGSKVADPGEKWNATDAISDPTLPAKRLIWAAVGGDYYVVHYERGGIAHTYHVLIAKLRRDDAKPKVIWSAVGGPFKHHAEFLDALRSGKLDDRVE